MGRIRVIRTGARVLDVGPGTEPGAIAEVTVESFVDFELDGERTTWARHPWPVVVEEAGRSPLNQVVERVYESRLNLDDLLYDLGMHGEVDRWDFWTAPFAIEAGQEQKEQILGLSHRRPGH